MKNRNIKIWFYCLCLLCLCACSSKEENLQEESYRTIKVIEVQGEVQVEREDLGMIDAYENMHLKSNDQIKVKEGSYARISLDDDKYVYAEEQTQFSVVAKGDTENSETTIHLEQGALTTEIQNALSEQSKYEIVTPNSTMAVRGTVYRVAVVQDGEQNHHTSLQVFDGKVATFLLQSDGTKVKEVLVPAGKEVQIASDKEVVNYVRDEQEEILKDLDLNELPLQALEVVKTIIEEQKNPDIVVALPQIEQAIEQAMEQEMEQENEEPLTPQEEMEEENVAMQEPLIPQEEIKQEQENETIDEPSSIPEDTKPPLKHYGIAFNSHGGTNVSSLSLQSGTTYELPSITRQGYEFAGWYQDQNYSNKHETNVVGSEDITLHAKWVPRNDTPYTIVSYVESLETGNYVVDAQETKIGTTDTKVNWKEVKNGFHLNETKSVDEGIIAPDGSMCLRLYYDRNDVVLTIQNGDETTKQVVKYGQSVPLKPIEKAGYTFLGYSTKADGTGQMIKDTYVMETNTTLYACFEPKKDTQFKVHYYKEEANQDAYTLFQERMYTGVSDTLVTSEMIDLPLLEECSYDVEYKTIQPDGSTIIDVYYKRNRYEVTYQYSNGKVKQESLKYGQNYTMTTYSNSLFYNKWFTQPDGAGEEVTKDETVTKDITLYEKIYFLFASYDVVSHFQDEDYQGYDNDVKPTTEKKWGIIHQNVQIKPDEVDGFYVNMDKSKLEGKITESGTLQLHIYYDRNKEHTVTFLGVNDELVKEVKVKDQETLAPPNYAVTGYNFLYWVNTENESEHYNGGIKVQKDLTLKAVMEARNDTSYTVKCYIRDTEDTYTLHKEESFKGTTDAVLTVDEVKKSMENYIPSTHTINTQKTNATMKISGDGTSVYELYLDQKVDYLVVLVTPEKTQQHRNQLYKFITYPNLGDIGKVENYYEGYYSQIIEKEKLPCWNEIENQTQGLTLNTTFSYIPTFDQLGKHVPELGTEIVALTQLYGNGGVIYKNVVILWYE